MGALKGRGIGGWSESYFPLRECQLKKLRGAFEGLGTFLVGGSSRSFHPPYCYADCPWKILGFEVEVCPGGGGGGKGGPCGPNVLVCVLRVILTLLAPVGGGRRRI